MRYIILICMSVFVMKAKAQAYPDIQETDSLPNRIIFYLPTADNDKLNLIKNEFIKYPQIQSAVYYYGTHNALLIELADAVNPKFFTYADIMKQIAYGIDYSDIKIKTPAVFDVISSETELSITKQILK